MELPLKGGYMCGAVRYEITCEPTRVYACHCTDCQRATTNAFSIGVAVPAEALRLSGKEQRGVSGGVTDSGRAKKRWVCPDCGICICGGVKPGIEPPGSARIVRGGTLDDTSWLRPTTTSSLPCDLPPKFDDSLDGLDDLLSTIASSIKSSASAP